MGQKKARKKRAMSRSMKKQIKKKCEATDAGVGHLSLR